MKIQLNTGHTHLGFELTDEVSFIRPGVIKPGIDKADFIEKLVARIDDFNILTNKNSISVVSIRPSTYLSNQT